MKTMNEPKRKVASKPKAQRSRTNGALTQIKKLLVPVDFSEPSQKAVKYAERFAEQFGASVTLVHVIEPVWYPHDWDYMPLVNMQAARDAQTKQTRRQLLSLAEKTVDEIVPVTVAVRSGSPWNEIAALAKEEQSDLIIIGTHGRTGLGHMFIGSTAERVVRHAPCPVLVVREREHDFVSKSSPRQTI
jgi:universal stress protein A